MLVYTIFVKRLQLILNHVKISYLVLPVVRLISYIVLPVVVVRVLYVVLLVAASPKSAVSPQPAKLVKPMKTLIEEQHIRESKPLLDQDEVRGHR